MNYLNILVIYLLYIKYIIEYIALKYHPKGLYSKEEIINRFVAIIEVLEEKPNARLDAIIEYEIKKIKSKNTLTISSNKDFPFVERTVEIVVKAIKKAYDYMNGNDIIEEETISENIINSFEIYFNSLHNENMKIESIDKSTIYKSYYKIQFKEVNN